MTKEEQYENDILKYFINMEPCTIKTIDELSTDPARFIAAVKRLMDDNQLPDLTFSNDYEKLYKNSSNYFKPKTKLKC